MEWIINSETALQKAIGDLREAWRRDRWLQVKARIGKTRSIPQNAIQHAWYTQMALEDRQEDLRGHTRYCKLTHGIPILCAADPDYRAMCNRLLGPLPYESRLEAMDHFPVTRLFTKAQESAYLAALQADYGRRGVRLEFPEPSARRA
jgi:hypothetical protein